MYDCIGLQTHIDNSAFSFAYCVRVISTLCVLSKFNYKQQPASTYFWISYANR